MKTNADDKWGQTVSSRMILTFFNIWCWDWSKKTVVSVFDSQVMINIYFALLICIIHCLDSNNKTIAERVFPLSLCL